MTINPLPAGGDNLSICYVPRVIKPHIAKHLSYPSLSLYEETISVPNTYSLSASPLQPKMSDRCVRVVVVLQGEAGRSIPR
jgi:hypothetical protein